MLTFKKAFVAALVLISAQASSQVFDGFYVQDVTVNAAAEADILLETGWSSNPRCWRVFACVNNPDYEMQAIYGNDLNPWILNSTGPLYQWFGGSVLSVGLNPAFYPAFPASEFDSYFTINTTWGGTLNTVNAPLPVPDPYAIFESGSGFTVDDVVGSTIFGAWGSGATEGLPDANDKVLVAQFTVEGSAVISGVFNFQFRRLNPDGTIFLPTTIENATGAIFDNTTFTDINTCMLVFLPVTMTGFELTPEDNRVKLNWKTESEQNSDYFAIERSSNGVDFTEVGRMPAAGNTSTTTLYYSYDTEPLPGTSYYRLRIMDTNGSYDYSELRTVTYLPQQAALFPNPAREILNISGLPAGVEEIRLTDTRGALIRTWYPEGDEITLQTRIDDLPSGLYFVEMRGQGSVYQTERLIINPR